MCEVSPLKDAPDFEVIDYDDVTISTPSMFYSSNSPNSAATLNSEDDENDEISYLPGIGKKMGKDGNVTGDKDKDKYSTSENLLGQRVELKWSSGRWYRGTICAYNKADKKHKVLYDDGDRKWYHLPEMVFRFIKEEDEWIDLDEDFNETVV